MAEKKLKKLKEDESSGSLHKKNSKIERINGWLEDQYERLNKSSSVNDSDWYEDESNPDDPSEKEDKTNVAEVRTKDGKNAVFRYSKEEYMMKCEWAECEFDSLKVDEFVKHVSGHLPQAEQRESGVMYCCLWDSCGFDSDDADVVVRHINYHSYHTKIKAIGSTIMKREQLPDCVLDYAGRNLLPVLPPTLLCEWDTCKYESNNFQLYLYHVQCHLLSLNTRGWTKVAKNFVCEWRDCKKSFKEGSKVKEHVRTHTQEKLVGCPVCGTQFSNKTKFYDHCQRQTSSDKKGFKCSHCRKNFATERILRDHIRLHVNLFKCPLCDMTCPFQSTLAIHIRYRHLSLKPFQCNFCEHRSKIQRDLENHQLTHCSENFWVCEQEDCDYSCRSKSVLQEHYARNHTENVDLCQYYCHICSNKYKRGADLTVHLKKVHSYRWASGHSRFRYIRGADGIYRLQTVRYESVEVTKEMMKTKTNKAIDPIPKKKYKCVFESPVSIVVKEEDEEEERKPTASSNAQAQANSDLSALNDENSSDSSDLEENLKNYLGLSRPSNCSKVVKNND